MQKTGKCRNLSNSSPFFSDGSVGSRPFAGCRRTGRAIEVDDQAAGHQVPSATLDEDWNVSGWLAGNGFWKETTWMVLNHPEWLVFSLVFFEMNNHFEWSLKMKVCSLKCCCCFFPTNSASWGQNSFHFEEVFSSPSGLIFRTTDFWRQTMFLQHGVFTPPHRRGGEINYCN